jgi:hypothetical protein
MDSINANPRVLKREDAMKASPKKSPTLVDYGFNGGTIEKREVEDGTR